MNRLSTLGLLVVAGCASSPSAPPDLSLDGTWHGRLDSPGGPLPFGIEFDGSTAALINGVERAPVSRVVQSGDEVTIEIDWYDAELRAVRTGDQMAGAWKKRTSSGWSTLPFVATRGPSRRFAVHEGEGGAISTVAGEWRVTFEDDDGPYLARGVFEQTGAEVRGTFLTETGDFRFLEGVFEGGLLRLSCFDGAHAFLFVAKGATDGRLVGDFWSRDVYHAKWTAERAGDGDSMPDPYGLANITNKEGRLRFSFDDVHGKSVSLEDDRFADKVVIVDIFGTWCPNCNDQAPVLAKWYERYRARGLEIVGLAYEVTGDVERDRKQIEVYRERHGLKFPILLAGTSDKKKAGATLPDLSSVVAYPTTIFVGRDGRVRKVHTGFAGPGTGERFVTLVREQEAVLERLLAEKRLPSVE